MSKKNLTILAIETSCDDTGISIIKCKPKSEKREAVFEILSNIVSSQVKIHAQYGGVYPLLAKREHQKNLPTVFKKAVQQAKLSLKEIDLIAVTVGPGLEPCLWQGINFAKKLAIKFDLPVVPINHIEAHILANWLDNKQQTINNEQIFPAIALIVSGGHTQLILMKDFGKYRILGETRDDAAGECFDKTARVLGLGYPGGPAIEKEASKANRGPASVDLPRPMIYHKNYDFSFSGLKTAVLYHHKKQPKKIKKSHKYIQTMAAEIQQAIIDVLILKTIKAAKEYKVKSIILGGGVIANNELKKQFKVQVSKLKLNFLSPPRKFCTDNGAMIGIAGYYNYLRKRIVKPENLKADANLRIA